ncbi:Hypothetical_protein [Hexamita inflata]|uniref:Hypothetical_protein n=1 Tax=Hexamita inflata TaxID=28002 RepID=A0AA86QG54_9EUKA|nr:Hypothetical protein HINF_LOCUS45163 [Hexamita inflata]
MLNIIFLASKTLIMVEFMPISIKNYQSADSVQICSNYVSRTQNIGFCVKESAISSRVQTATITHSPMNNIFHSLYTTRTQDLQLNLTYQMLDLPSFALFGLTSTIQLVNSNIIVFVPQDLAQGSLVCFTCDVNATSTDFSFIGSAKNISGIVLEPLTVVQLEQSLIQLRIQGMNVGGLILNASKITVTLAECNVSCYVAQAVVSGTISTYNFETVSLGVTNVKICSNVHNQGQGAVTQTGTFTITCTLCRDNTYTYGICLQSLEFGEIVDDKLVCKNIFEFTGEWCACPEGYQPVSGQRNFLRKHTGLYQQANCSRINYRLRVRSFNQQNRSP